MILFALATLLPAVLLCLGAIWGGVWIWAGVSAITVLCFTIDRLIAGEAARRNADTEFPAGDVLSVTLALLHLPMLLLAVTAIGAGNAVLPLTPWDRIGVLIGFGLFFGQIGHPNAHELIHRSGRVLRDLGVMIYATLLMGHHASAHRLVHHVHVATGADPNSAPKGLGFWRFAPRAWLGSFRAGLRAETALRSRSSRMGHPIHPYFIYTGWSLIIISSSTALAGWAGLLACLGLAGYAQVQILLADYVQHYGLRRSLRDNGKPEPVNAAHSWNSPHLFSSAMMLNAPRHSDHHIHPSRPYPALRLTPDMPRLPHSLPVMAVIALIPPLWRRVMDHRLNALSPTNVTPAAPASD
ncbi:alkane 1-monooxygenase [Thalassovita litoralis]|jgi:alkane 1-monooxygenase|uniref:Alkane 1-monooxygenase n=1 Tax=Thalassovita litoralis TaxID=1010611 RepID=A0A521BG32_9RHOB|nr:alkane 1-monooxygenase [Thalassovita litoralis]SMO46032.1 alkane 1-monooxygenase [Thalassovita litoralis]